MLTLTFRTATPDEEEAPKRRSSAQWDLIADLLQSGPVIVSGINRAENARSAMMKRNIRLRISKHSNGFFLTKV